MPLVESVEKHPLDRLGLDVVEMNSFLRTPRRGPTSRILLEISTLFASGLLQTSTLALPRNIRNTSVLDPMEGPEDEEDADVALFSELPTAPRPRKKRGIS